MHRSRSWLMLLSLICVASFSSPGRATDDKSKSAPKPKRVATYQDFSEWVTSVAFSSDAKSAWIGSYQTIQRNSLIGEKTVKISVKPGFVKSLACSSDGKWLAAGHYQTVTLWDARSLEKKHELKGHRAYVSAVAFSANGKWLATASEDESVRIWSLSLASPKALVVIEHQYPVMSVAFSPDSKTLATASGDDTRVTRPGLVKLFDVESGKELKKLENHKKVATGVAYSPDGSRLVSTSLDETVNVYDANSGKALGFFGGHSRPTNCAVFAPDGQTVVSGSGGRAVGKNEVKFWNLATGDEWQTIGAHKGRVSSLAISRDGTQLLTGSYDKTAVLWNIASVLDHAKKNRPQEKLATISAPKNGDTQKSAGNSETETISGAAADPVADEAKPKPRMLRAGIIGLDTSHVLRFTEVLNVKPIPEVAGVRIVAAYPKGSPDIESSVSRVPGYIEKIKKMDVEIVDSIAELLERVDVVFLETNDGRPHLEQVLPVLKAGKPVFVDKPIAGSLADAVAIFEAARKYKVPLFSSSSLRFSSGIQGLRNGKIGVIKKCETYGPCSLEKTHPDLFWYGIHGVEALFTVMGTGCQSVKRTISNADMDEVVGVWANDREGTYRGYRKGGPKGFGGKAEGTKGSSEIGRYEGYAPMLIEIVKFFRSGKPPVSEKETLEIYAFMVAADESKRQNGASVTLQSVLKEARTSAKKRLAELESATDNQLTSKEKATGWKLLFNGKDQTGWKTNNGKPIKATIEDGALVPYKAGGYLVVYEKPFADFILKLDVMMGEKCNSGVFFRVGDLKSPVQTGFEVQVMQGDGTGYHDFGAIYDLAKPSTNSVKKPGEWVSMTIKCQGPNISVAVNGKPVSKLNCDEFTLPGKRPDGTSHKFKKAVTNFPRKGYIGLQDHGHKVWFKNIKILELK